MDLNAKNEEQFIDDIKDAISNSTLKVSQKVIISAYEYLKKNNCIASGKDNIFNDFLISKVPAVLSKEVTKELETVLGLDIEIEN